MKMKFIKARRKNNNDFLDRVLYDDRDPGKPVCNCCGKELDLMDRESHLSIHTQVGYGSKHDGSFVLLNLCNRCFDTIADQCVVSPILGGDEA